MSTLVKPSAVASAEEKRALLAERLRTAAAQTRSIPLSFAQQRLWFLDQLEPNSPLYNIPVVVRMKGKLDLSGFQHALETIVARHESLRTRFACVDGEPEQIVDESSTFKMDLLDLFTRPETERKRAAQEIISAEINTPFNLRTDHLLRVRLLRLKPEEHLLVINMHHIVSDEWSLKVFFRELGELYQVFAAGKASPLPALPIQYADYALWQREWLRGGVLADQLDYWRKQLHEAPTPLELPTDWSRPAESTFRGAREIRILPPELTQLVKNVAERHNATTFMVLLAAFKTLLHRYTQQEDIIVGSPIAGRNRIETENLIGFFVNTLALRTNLAGNPTLEELLGRVRETMLGALAHADLPFEKVVEELHPERNGSHLPFSRIMFAVQNACLQEIPFADLSLRFEDVESTTAKFDITFIVQESAGGFKACLEYSTDLFDPATIQRLLGHYESLLKGIAANPKQRLSELPLLTPAEREELLVQWNDTRTEYPRDKSIADLFEAQVSRSPNAVAAVFGNESATYRELNTRANQLARYLQKAGVGPETLVGVCVGRSVEMIAALLAILKAGGAYVPLDANYPRERLAFMLADAQAPVLLTQQRLLERVPKNLVKIICLDSDWELVARERRENLANIINAESLAYVMYTSGSTGKPKGVAIAQRAIARLVLNTNYLDLSADDRVAQASNASFDAATFEIWGALLNGAKLVGITRDVALSPKDFARELRDQKISAIFLTTALFNQLASEAPGAFETVRTVIAGGEALDPKWVRAVLRDRPPQRLINGYGPTENTTFSCWYPIPDVGEDATNIPIGRPIANTRAYVLDAHLNPVPVGVPGELHLGGDGLARGYWNRRELTVEKFIPNPFEPGGAANRLYKTGDLVRWLPGGNLEFLGRIDQQVKIRGFRVELGEIETILSQHPAVRECAVTFCENGAGHKRLVAYLVPAAKRVPTTTELRRALKEKLPDYMVPAVFVPLPSLPLTPNGKLDRQALPPPDHARPTLERKYASPRDAVELELTRIWEEVLGVQPVGIEDRFFDLGGHSLLAVRVIAHIEKAFGKKLRLATVFQAQTVEQLASIIREEIKEGSPTAGTSIVEIQSRGSRPPIFFVHGAGGGMFWGYVNLSRHLGRGQPVYGLKSRGLDGCEEFATIEAMAAQYIADIRVVQPLGPYCLGGYCFGGDVAFEMARQLEAQREEVAFLALINCAPPNSRYARIRWTPRWALRFVGNLFFCAKHFCQLSAEQRGEFFRWKVATLKRKLGGWRGRAQPEIRPVDAGDLVDLSSYSAEQRRLWEAHIRALVNFHPRPFGGRVHLFRTPGHPLLCSFDPDYGWSDFARGGVRVSIIPGAHEKILEEPCVAELAREFNQCIVEMAQEEIPDVGKQNQPVLPVQTVAKGLRLPLSPAQRRVWFLDQFDPQQSSYNIPTALRLKGKLDVAALQGALTELTKRHEALRAVFPAENGQPIQLIYEPKEVNLPVFDVRAAPGAEREMRAAQIAAQEARRSYILANLMLRPVLIRISEKQHLLLLMTHQIASDSQSVRILVPELVGLYGALAAGQTPALPPLTARYAELVAGGRLPAEEEMAQLDYWKHQLDGAPALLDLPADRRRPAHQSDQGARSPVAIPQAVSTSLAQFAQAEDCTPFMVLLAAFQTLLSRYTGTTDIVVGASVSERQRAGTENVIGHFENLVALRTDLAGEPTFRELLGRVRHVTLGSLAHGLLPFEKVLDELQPARNASYTPVFQVMFEWEEALAEQSAAGVAFVPCEVDNLTSKLDLTLHLENSAAGLRGWLEYNTALFDSTRMARMAEHFATLLAAAVEYPDEHIYRLRLLPEKEHRRVVVEWNATEKEYPRGATLAQLFEAQVARAPEAVALVCGSERISYRELNGRANQLAHHLRSLGVGPEVLVGICCERSSLMLAGILAVLKAGGAYVPMDPAYPKERLAFILEDAKAPILLTQASLRRLCSPPDTRVISLDADWATIERESPENPFSGIEAHHLAYVIYTSGSTGRPKGVALAHRNAVSLVDWAKRAFAAEELSGVLASTSICFDLSIFEMFVPLSWGGKVILAENALALPTLPAANEVTMINTVPSAIRELLRVKGVPASVQVVNLAGEPLATSLVDQIYQQTAARKVYDLYGPTETTTYSTYTLRQAREPATIGKPLDNEQVLLLDAHLQPVPIGIPGELYIGGDGLARGYLNRPELTAEKFIPHPFQPGARLYRTGDLARWRDDGNLEFLGRIDHQVKIRGFRMELGEIESVLRQHPKLREVVVVAREDDPGNKRLVAYVVADSLKPPTTDDLRRLVKEKLPEYMVPSAFVFLEALPLTPNGKVDRKALPAPEQDRQAASAEFVAPRNAIEAKLAEIWCEVLRLKQVGMRDNFFELGGHSLLAIQVISRIREAFKVELPLFSMFDAPTIATLAEGLNSGQWTQHQLPIPPLERIPRAERLPVSFVQERLWFIDQLEPGSCAYNVPVAVRLRGKIQTSALQRALDEMVRRHEALRTTFVLESGNLSQVIAPFQPLPLKVIDLRTVPAAEREAKAQAAANTEAQKQFDLTKGPLVRVSLVELTETDHVLVAVMHHTISDGWSLAIFFQELDGLYTAFAANKPAPALPELPVQYVDFAQWRRNWMQGAALEAELAYWKTKLEGAPGSVNLPVDQKDRVQTGHPGARQVIVLSKELTDALNSFCQRAGSTVFMALISALFITLRKWTQQPEMVLGTVVAGRSRREIENVIGCFMNFLPLRARVRDDETAGELLAHVKAIVLEAQSHQDCPFEKIVEAVNPERRLNQNPLYNVAFLLQNFPTELFKGDALSARSMPVETGAALLDLRFEAEPTESGLSLLCEYRTDLFEARTIEHLLASCAQVVAALVREPQANVADFKITEALEAQAATNRSREQRQTIALAATFTAEPIEDSLRYWMSELDIAAEIQFAPYNQIFQQLLDPLSPLAKNPRGLNVVLVRLEDWERSEDAPNQAGAPTAAETLQRNVREFVAAVRGASNRSSVPLLVFICPPSKLAGTERAGLYRRLEQEMAAELDKLSGVYPIRTAELLGLYPVTDYYDASADELGHIPYTPMFFSALGTAIARKFHGLLRAPYKVIALDCDQTLWAGVCGEDGPKGICLDEPRRALQAFMRSQLDAGMLLCVCSKNNEEDVREVFAQRSDMPLRSEHFAAWRLNWRPKSENLKSLAEELNLGLDSIIFIDDNPVECAEVEANCPHVLTLQLPENPELIPQFLQHCWALDHLKLTAEDCKRTELYLQNRQREQLREETLSLAAFLAGLNLKIDIAPMSSGQLPRVAQLTQRTNQFNFTTRRRTEAEVQRLADGFEVLTVSVSDRFGNYGLVGVMICRGAEQALEVDTMLLSCRVLGRGVEHKMLARLGALALERALSWVDAHYVPSPKNKPALDFLENVGAQFRQSLNGGFVFRFPARYAADVAFNPQEAAEPPAVTAAKSSSLRGERAAPVQNQPARKFVQCGRIALESSDPARIHQAIEAKAVSHAARQADYVAPRTDLERNLCDIWQKLLHVERVGIRDNFFELGGHSLLAVRLFAEIEKLTGRKFPLVTLFQAPSIEQLAAIFSQSDAASTRSPLVPIQPHGSKPPLFLVHGAGGDIVWGYANLATHMSADQPVYGIKSRGQVGLEEFDRIEQMAAYYLEELRRFQPRGPYYLGGYCFGGNVAYEMARQLHSDGERVALLALLDSSPANAGYEKITWWRPQFGIRFARNFCYWIDDFRDLKPVERRSFVARKLRTLGRKIARRFARRRTEVDLEEVIELSHFPENELKLWRIHLQALTDHEQQPYAGHVTLLRTRGQPMFCSFEEDFCWSKLAQGGVAVKRIPGSHENIFMEPNVRFVAKQLEACLAQAQAQGRAASEKAI